MDDTRTVAGVYVERSRAVLQFAKMGVKQYVPFIPAFVEFMQFQEYEWSPDDPTLACALLYDIGKAIGEYAATDSSLVSAAVAGYGPFVSLNPNDDRRYGAVDPRAANPPFAGINLSKLFRQAISEGGGPSPFYLSIHTDANACALGEAFSRSYEGSENLLYILATEGIGCGIVEGPKIRRSALHPEIGLLSVRFDAKDHLKPPKQSNLYGRSLGFLADNRSLRMRHEADTGFKNVSNNDLTKVANDSIWQHRAYYLAQACLACTALLAPHKIVIGADIDPHDDIAALTREKFKKFVKERERESAPMLRYDALNDLEGYISASKPFESLKLPPSPSATGVVGMCAFAAGKAF